MREADIEKAIKNWAASKGISTLKLNGQGARGKADRLFMKAGKAVFLELKAENEQPNPLQHRFIKERIQDGFDAGWADNVQDAKALLTQWFKL